MLMPKRSKNVVNSFRGTMKGKALRGKHDLIW